MNITSTSLDPHLLRSNLLFWDRLVWPSSRAIYIGGGPDEEYLISCGILKRPDYTVSGSSALLLETQILAFQDLNTKEPGQWAMSQDIKSFNLIDDAFITKRGTLLKLLRAIPVPDKDIPLNEVLEFKEKRRDELIVLRLKVDQLYDRIVNSRDTEFALNSALAEVEQACNDAIRVAKETKLPFKLADWDLNISMEPIAIATGVVSTIVALYSGIPLNGSLLTGASLALSKSFSLRKQPTNSQPFRYITSIHDEFI